MTLTGDDLREIRAMIVEEVRRLQPDTPKAMRARTMMSVKEVCEKVRRESSVRISPQTLADYEAGRVTRFTGSVLSRLRAIGKALGVGPHHYTDAVMKKSESSNMTVNVKEGRKP